MIPHLANIRYTKFLHEKINNLFKKDSIIFVLKIFEEEFTSNNFSKEYNYLYKLLLCLLEKAHSNFNLINSNTNKNICINNNTANNVNGNNNISISTLLNDNNYYYKLFQSIIENIFSFYNTSKNLITCQVHVLLAKTFQKLIKLIYKHYKPSTINNKDKINIC